MANSRKSRKNAARELVIADPSQAVADIQFLLDQLKVMDFDQDYDGIQALADKYGLKWY